MGSIGNWGCRYLTLFPLALFVSSRIDRGAKVFMKAWKLEKGILSSKGEETRNCKVTVRINDAV